MFSLAQKILKSIFSATVGCVWGYYDYEVSNVAQPKPLPKRSTRKKPKIRHKTSPSFFSRNGYLPLNRANETPSTFRANIDMPPRWSAYEQDSRITWVVSPCRKICNSLAVEKNSNDPYEDFRRSMLQMIWEKEILSEEDLQELLDCFLKFNSPSQHDVIVRAFTDIWNRIVCSSPRY